MAEIRELLKKQKALPSTKTRNGLDVPVHPETLERVYGYFKRFLQREEGRTDWDWTDDHKYVFKNFLWWLNGDSDKTNWNLQQGVILSGPNGTGKSTFMKFFSELSKQMYLRGSRKRFGFVECRVITDYIEATGDVSYLHTYYRKNENCAIAFNEFGKEKLIVNWGNKINPVQQILVNRFDLRLAVFGTTNLAHDDTGHNDIYRKYGSDLDSRFHNTNYITLCGDKVSDIEGSKYRDYRVRNN